MLNNFELCLEDIYIKLYEKELIKIEDTHAIKLWIQHLKRLNYKFPKLTNE
jgi:hypothetical protein